jgi:hypothetical protein
MDSYIKGVAIFKDNSKEGKRILELSRGLNIITGHSKTGKSAILDIIDWCLGSKDSTIPQGVITDFANVYAIILYVKGISFLIARKNGALGLKYLHIKQINDNLTIDDIVHSDLKDENYLKISDALAKLNESINLGIGEEKLLDVDFKIPNVTLRSALPFNFQHQDIISSNSRLFYLDPIKNHFPILAGWFSADYYIVLESISKLKKQLKVLRSKNAKAKEENSKLEFNLISSLRTYYKLIGVDFNENWDVSNCLTRINTLEGYKKEEYSNDLQKRQNELDKVIEEHQTQLARTNRTLSKLETQENSGKNYGLFIERYEQRGNLFSLKEEYVCPICEKPNEKLSLNALDILEANNWLKEELVKTPTQLNNFTDEVKKTKLEKSNLFKKLSDFRKEYKENEIILNKITKGKNLNEEKQKAQWRVKSEADIYMRRHIKTQDKYIEEQDALLSIFTEKKKSFSEKEYYDEAKFMLEDKMSNIVELLDFEHKPPELRFELNPQNEDDYKLFHNKTGKERVFLRQIGSASNALACHIGLFLSFLSYFTRQENSKVPSFLFFDQPSQVYFPSGNDKDNTDIEKVAQIYSTILDEIETIEKETGICPQIIVADHIKDLGDETVKLYGHYFKADWRGGKGLI